jgi:diaminopimelate epimerase
MKKVKFWKMSGSGNDFVMIDNRRKVIANREKAARALCHRHFGVGADGLLLLESSKREDFRMVYYNADGSRADMCGNGARCMAYFAQAHKAASGAFRFETDAYPVGARVRKNNIEVTLADAKDYRSAVEARVEGQVYHPAFLNTGVPHAVVFVPYVNRIDVQRVGRALRFHKAFGPKGTNVNFVQKVGPQTLRIRTYERGVEGETLACGTGVTASAIAAVRRGLVKAPVRCQVAGGDTLVVHFNSLSDTTGIRLSGPVSVTFKGEAYV